MAEGAQRFRITRQLEIDAAHRVPEHGSKCRALHGHRYRILASCVGDVAVKGVETGMLLDFKFLKEGMVRYIDEPCDHGLILRYDDPLLAKLHPIVAANATAAINRGEKFFYDISQWNIGLHVYAIPVVPTAENLAQHWFERLEPFVAMRSDRRAVLEKIEVFETPNCSAVYPVDL